MAALPRVARGRSGRPATARTLTESSREWDAGGRDPGDLYRGARLSAALDWSAQHRDELSPVEREFIAASRNAAGRAARRLRGVLAGVAVLLVVSLIAGIIALVQKHDATTEARVALAQRLGAEAVIEPGGSTWRCFWRARPSIWTAARRPRARCWRPCCAAPPRSEASSCQSGAPHRARPQP